MSKNQSKLQKSEKGNFQNLMPSDRIKNVVENLTGKKITLSKQKSEISMIERISKKDPLHIGYNELNEILLIFNKDRLSKDFFEYFFLRSKKNKKTLTINELERKVEDFRKLSMLLYGNFIYSYKSLSQMGKNEIERELEKFPMSHFHIKNFKNRPSSLQKIKKIKKENTYFLGYLSAGNIEIDLKAAIEIQKACESYKKTKKKTKLCKYVLNYVKKNHRKYSSEKQEKITAQTEQILCTYFDNRKINFIAFEEFINESLLEIIKINDTMEKVRQIGKINTDVYLTWDHLDIYLATSMRHKWEYEDFSSFIKKIFKEKEISSLKLRYFDPTQSYDDSRVNKGLVEGLMLKRAKCTIYSSQEIDTLGKDSELAATLAQGKPVIAYIPNKNNTKKYAKELECKPLRLFKTKLNLLTETFEKIEVVKECLSMLKKNKINIPTQDELDNFLNDFNSKIMKHLGQKAWNSIKTEWATDESFKRNNKKKFAIFCKLIAIADKHFYNSRANTLKNIHPLGLQVNLETGVANGVLVVREIDTCAKLLYNLLTNRLSFYLHHDKDNRCWCLKEKLSKSIYRVVSDDVKLTNTFWNFYRLNRRRTKC
ncbi:MAG: hypothetical protein ACOC56_03900 [Atribacterota bacterium]